MGSDESRVHNGEYRRFNIDWRGERASKTEPRQIRVRPVGPPLGQRDTVEALRIIRGGWSGELEQAGMGDPFTFTVKKTQSDKIGRLPKLNQ